MKTIKNVAPKVSHGKKQIRSSRKMAVAMKPKIVVVVVVFPAQA